MLLGIIILPLLGGFSLICKMWAFPLTHVVSLCGERTGFSFLGWRQGLGCFIGLASSLGLESGPAHLFFKPYQLPPNPCVRYAWARAVSFLVSGAISTCLLRVGLVRALLSLYVL